MSRARAAVVLSLLFAIAFLARLPLLLDAWPRLTSDEAVNALVIRHLMLGQEITLFNWSAFYYGIAEGLMTVPLFAVFGFTAAVVKMGAVIGHGILMLASYLLAARLFGRSVGLFAAGMLVCFSPALLYWSTLAGGGYCLIAALGTFTILQFDRCLAAPTPRRILGLGVLCGFSFYVYQLFVVYLLALTAWTVAWALSGLQVARRSLPLLPWARNGVVRVLVPFVSGFAVGWLPRLANTYAISTGSRVPVYALATPAAMLSNLHLLVFAAAPSFLGIDWHGDSLAQTCGAISGTFVLIAWSFAAARIFVRPGADTGRRFGTLELLVLLLPLTAVLFVAGPNVRDSLSNRYLIPWLTPLSIFAGWLLERCRRWGGLGVAGALAILTLAPIHFWSTMRAADLVDRNWHLHTLREPLFDVVAELERRHIAGAYAPYWVAYKATFIAQERVVFAATDWDRYPPYSAFVDRQPTEAYVFAVDPEGMDKTRRGEANEATARFESKLRAAGLGFESVNIPPYRVYVSADGKRLLPPPIHEPVTPIAEARATIRPLETPPTLSPAAEVTIPVEIGNTSSAFWSAEGLPLLAGSLRVTGSYRWLHPDGSVAVVEGLRTPLPHDVARGAWIRLALKVRTPDAPGLYRLQITLVQDNVAWFDQATGSQAVLPIDVR